jgi:diacylglycerol kinase family enzyme
MSQKSKPLDVLSINNTFMLLHLGDVGANANLVANYDKDDSRGMLTYAKHFWSEFQNLKSFDFEIETDEMEYVRKGVMLSICNGRKFGTGIPLNTIGKMDDGYFELVIVKAVDFSDVLKAALSKFDEDYQLENLETIQAKTATVKFKEPRLLQIDGEVVGKFIELKIKVLKKAISFIQ